VIHGANDFASSMPKASPRHRLQRRGIPRQLLYFPDENHWILKAKNSIVWHETFSPGSSEVLKSSASFRASRMSRADMLFFAFKSSGFRREVKQLRRNAAALQAVNVAMLRHRRGENRLRRGSRRGVCHLEMYGWGEFVV